MIKAAVNDNKVSEVIIWRILRLLFEEFKSLLKYCQ